jgi:hypothetical protein
MNLKLTSRSLRRVRSLPHVLATASAFVLAGTPVIHGFELSGARPSPTKPASAVAPTSDSAALAKAGLGARTRAALEALRNVVRPLSYPGALEKAFHGYFAFKAAHPDQVRKPYLYFVDFGLPSTAPRGYVFDMSSLKVVEGPFPVAHGRGSSETKSGIPTYFSNRSGSYATSLGLYVAEQTYPFSGRMAGGSYSSVGLRLSGVSSGFNDNAFARKVVAHGAPYVTPTKAGRSEGCPAMEPARAKRLLPKLADGGVVLLFAPDQDWMSRDPWVAE